MLTNPRAISEQLPLPRLDQSLTKPRTIISSLRWRYITLMERIISRSLERGATALAAYYTAEKIQDIRTEVLHDYRKKKVLFESMFLGAACPQTPRRQMGKENSLISNLTL